jgi:hypothetical protein
LDPSYTAHNVTLLRPSLHAKEEIIAGTSLAHGLLRDDRDGSVRDVDRRWRDSAKWSKLQKRIATESERCACE